MAVIVTLHVQANKERGRSETVLGTFPDYSVIFGTRHLTIALVPMHLGNVLCCRYFRGVTVAVSPYRHEHRSATAGGARIRWVRGL